MGKIFEQAFYDSKMYVANKYEKVPSLFSFQANAPWSLTEIPLCTYWSNKVSFAVT